MPGGLPGQRQQDRRISLGDPGQCRTGAGVSSVSVECGLAPSGRNGKGCYDHPAGTLLVLLIIAGLRRLARWIGEPLEYVQLICGVIYEDGAGLPGPAAVVA